MFGRVVFFFSFSIVAVATVANALARPAKRYPEIDCDDLVNLDSMLDSSASYPRIPAETSHRTTLTPINGLLPLPQCHYYWLESERERERELRTLVRNLISLDSYWSMFLGCASL